MTMWYISLKFSKNYLFFVNFQTKIVYRLSLETEILLIIKYWNQSVLGLFRNKELRAVKVIVMYLRHY